MYVFNRFGNGQNLTLDEIELKSAKQSVLNILPGLNWEDVTS